MPEPLLAAGLTFNTQKLLEKYILNFKIEKSIIKLDFIKDRFNEAEKIYTQKQYQLASYQDRNKYLVSAKSQTRLATLKGEFNLSYEVYSELAKQLETQKIQVKEDTPVFTTVKPVLVPVEKNAPKRMVIIFVFTVLGLLLAITTVLLKEKYLLLTDKKK
ncbi:GNVR domain-containing protein [Tenacibaculum aquimarinum]|uniref:GNVR domain-containing protein n=1 Tax=Tenacibaculum aquimarinum TaxID=2910675 RepID=UPI001F0AF346|nr:GNVR domain-containing protein [Tenacibaculum aquimarinum]MCH3884613.1 hypothetical protein [Tenacibaculum aquimarinum]